MCFTFAAGNEKGHKCPSPQAVAATLGSDREE